MNRSQDWLSQAERDLTKAEIDMEYAYWEWACFTSQQAAEKACKALMLHSGRTVWGYAITPMLRSLTEIRVPEQIIKDGQLLDTYYIPTRYPNGFAEGKPADYFNESNARQAIHAAGAIIRFCKDLIDQPG